MYNNLFVLFSCKVVLTLYILGLMNFFLLYIDHAAGEAEGGEATRD